MQTNIVPFAEHGVSTILVLGINDLINFPVYSPDVNVLFVICYLKILYTMTGLWWIPSKWDFLSFLHLSGILDGSRVRDSDRTYCSNAELGIIAYPLKTNSCKVSRELKHKPRVKVAIIRNSKLSNLYSFRLLVFQCRWFSVSCVSD